MVEGLVRRAADQHRYFLSTISKLISDLAISEVVF